MSTAEIVLLAVFFAHSGLLGRANLFIRVIVVNVILLTTICSITNILIATISDTVVVCIFVHNSIMSS